jgi:hypothetical protein
LETYPADRVTRSKTRLNPLQGTVNEKRNEEETILQPARKKAQQENKPMETKKEEPKKKPATKNTKKKAPVLTPVEKMTDPYTLQQLFGQSADISVGQLLAMNPKLRMSVNRALRKPTTRKKNEDKEKKTTKKNEKSDEEETHRAEDLMTMAATRPNSDKWTALYCEASIKHIKFPLIVDSGFAECIISLALLKDLEMEITKASKIVMVNVNGERRRPLGAVTDVPLTIQDFVIPMDAIVTDADTYAAIVGNDWLKKVKAHMDYETDNLTLK